MEIQEEVQVQANSDNSIDNSLNTNALPRERVEHIITSMDASLYVVNYTVNSKTKPGDNYMSEIYSVAVTGVTKSEPWARFTRSFLYKTLPQNQGTRKVLNDCLAFVKEAKMYQEVFPDFVKRFGLELDVPICFASFNNGVSDYLALEDLSLQGYQMEDRLHGLGLEECAMALRYLAKFHAVSYAAFEGDFQKIISKYSYLHNHERIFVPADQVSPMALAYVRQTGQSYCDAFVETENFKDASTIRNLLVQSPESVLELFHKRITSPVKHAVIGHGDYWTNNLLFKYEENNDIPWRKPIGMKMIDFQMSRVGSRAIDVHLFLQTSLATTIQNDSTEKELLQIYHSEFTSVLTSFGIQKPELSFEQLQEEFDDYRYVGICMGLFYIQFVNARTEDIGEIDGLQGTADEIMYQFFRPLLNPDTLKKVSYILKQYNKIY